MSGHGGRRSTARVAITADASPVITPSSAIRFPSTAAVHETASPRTTKTPTGVAEPPRILATGITVVPSTSMG
jgi:hypothetical protein